jgi:hypothetical protein
VQAPFESLQNPLVFVFSAKQLHVQVETFHVPKMHPPFGAEHTLLLTKADCVIDVDCKTIPLEEVVVDLNEASSTMLVVVKETSEAVIEEATVVVVVVFVVIIVVVEKVSPSQ